VVLLRHLRCHCHHALKYTTMRAVVTFLLLAVAAVASAAETNDDVRSVDSATRRWMDTVTSGGEDAAEATAALYASDAVLWGTVSEEIRASPASVQQYFDYYASLDSLSVVEGSYQPSIRVFGDVAISSGTYTFRYAEGGVERLVPQRFTFVYRRSADSAAGWEIVDHHSSQMPAQPDGLAETMAAAGQLRGGWVMPNSDLIRQTYRHYMTAGGWTGPKVVAGTAPRQAYRHYTTASGWTGPGSCSWGTRMLNTLSARASDRATRLYGKKRPL